jgi:SAM-dependent methyltransferase
VGLAEHFERVVATDASASQIAHAAPHPRVEYRVAPAEASGLTAGSVDLVTAAQALHWFDIPGFFAEARRALAPGGVLAVWCYGDPTLGNPVLNEILWRYNRGTIEQYWPPERDLVLAEYRSIRFPLEEVPAPRFSLEVGWSLPELMGYLRSWSATARYATAHGSDPVVEVEAAMRPAWQSPDARQVMRWPVTLRVGRA